MLENAESTPIYSNRRRLLQILFDRWLLSTIIVKKTRHSQHFGAKNIQVVMCHCNKQQPIPVATSLKVCAYSNRNRLPIYIVCQKMQETGTGRTQIVFAKFCSCSNRKRLPLKLYLPDWDEVE